METQDVRKLFPETVCIEVPKVYDFCFQAERRENVCFDLPEDCEGGVSAECKITNVSCNEVLPRSEPDERGRANVVVAIQVTLKIKIRDACGDVVCKLSDLSFGFTKTVSLCAPATPFPTTVVCDVPNFACGPCLVLGNQVCCNFDLCIVIQSLAVVKLLVPSFGFCVPHLCESVSPVGPFVCPPELFPQPCGPKCD
ncbi:hypothetical protein L7E55_04590 [Pelotomaculum isophthalicicum JI]|uniref:Uncharacterized protein n=1 Tax=Pelotomaculum isophthalicicum JI TaxID=947010 RepID=A0A9X4GYC9_9FIRM|nr:hypothetical protein [Pelotomaculum isophthalicicum]MDF9407642.1 hypothetical protein [Pelotomaculum isophthalicicum JI]